METVRVWLAGLFVFVGITLAGLLLVKVMERGSSLLFILAILALTVFICILGLVATALFNMPLTKSAPPVDYALQVREWEQQGLLTATDFHATRAIRFVEESTDEDVDDEQWLLLELDDKSILFLNGDYFHDAVYDEDYSSDEDSSGIGRSFPCTDFSINRHNAANYVVEFLCRGQLIPYETLPFTFNECWIGPIPKDGDILTGRSFDELRENLFTQFGPE